MSTEQSFRCAAVTIKQSGSSNWKNERRKRITSTKVYNLINAWIKYQKKKIEYKTLLTKFQPKDVKSAATDHGNKFEPFARKKFIEVTGWEVFDIGLVCKDKFSFFGGSPDGLIRLPNGKYGILELKCSFKYKDDEKIGKIKYLDDQGHLREKHTYYRFFFVRSTNFFTY